MPECKAYKMSEQQDIDTVIGHIADAHKSECVETDQYNIYHYRNEDGLLIGYDVVYKD